MTFAPSPVPPWEMLPAGELLETDPSRGGGGGGTGTKTNHPYGEGTPGLVQHLAPPPRAARPFPQHPVQNSHRRDGSGGHAELPPPGRVLPPVWLRTGNPRNPATARPGSRRGRREAGPVPGAAGQRGGGGRKRGLPRPAGGGTASSAAPLAVLRKPAPAAPRRGERPPQPARATRGNPPPRRRARGGGGGGARPGGRGRRPAAPGCWRRHPGVRTSGRRGRETGRARLPAAP